MSDAVLETAPPSSGTVEVLGARCFVGRLDEAADALVDRAVAGAGGYVVHCNVHVLMTAQQDPGVMRALSSAWWVMPDGAPVAWLARRNGAADACRIGGPDLMKEVMDRGRSRELRHVLFGSTPAVVELLGARLRAELPGLQIAGAVAPPFGQEHDPAQLAAVRAAAPHIIWLALGAPKQELWMAEHSASLAPALVVGVGAAFDFHAGTTRRAPLWMQRAGLEWLHRLCTEPRRLARRYMTTNSSFVVAAGRGMLANRRRDRGRRGVGR